METFGPYIYWLRCQRFYIMFFLKPLFSIWKLVLRFGWKRTLHLSTFLCITSCVIIMACIQSKSILTHETLLWHMENNIVDVHTGDHIVRQKLTTKSIPVYIESKQNPNSFHITPRWNHVRYVEVVDQGNVRTTRYIGEDIEFKCSAQIVWLKKHNPFHDLPFIIWLQNGQILKWNWNYNIERSFIQLRVNETDFIPEELQSALYFQSFKFISHLLWS